MSSLIVKAEVILTESLDRAFKDGLDLSRQLRCDVRLNIGNYSDVLIDGRFDDETAMRLSRAQHQVNCERSAARDQSKLDEARARFARPVNRWDVFTLDELRLINRALTDSGGMHSDYSWYLACSKLHQEIVKVVLERSAVSAPKAEPKAPLGTETPAQAADSSTVPTTPASSTTEDCSNKKRKE